MLEGDDLTIEDQLGLKMPTLTRQLRKLLGHAPQIARENFHALGAAMELRADPIEFIFDIDYSHVALRSVAQTCNKPVPDRFGRWLGAGQHAFDRAKDRQLRAL